MHDSFMIVLSTLFVVVFAIMMHSMVKHRRKCDHSTAKLTGANGTVQWLWALVPFAILAFVDIALINAPKDRNAHALKEGGLTIAQNQTSALSSLVDSTQTLRSSAADSEESVLVTAYRAHR